MYIISLFAVRHPRHMLVWLCLFVIAAGCRSGRTLSLTTLPNYVPDRPNLIFLDFNFRTIGKADQYKVTLVNAIAGRGTMKKSLETSHSNRQVEVGFIQANGQPMQTVRYDHPLYRSAEFPADDGLLQRQDVSLNESNLSIRFPFQPDVTQLDLYDLTNGQSRKIYTLRLKP